MSDDTAGMQNGLRLKQGILIDYSTVSCESDRLMLVPATAAFGDEIFKEFTPEITRYMTPKPCDDRAGVEVVIQTFASQRAKGIALVFGITLRRTGEFVGCCGIHADATPSQPELGLWIKKSAHGHRYGREAVHTLVAFASQHFEVDGFRYSVDKRNIASVKIPESLGGVVIEEKRVTSMNGNELDEVVFLIPVS